jgi:uncharacterized membrane protein YjjP (DUF1212 family)
MDPETLEELAHLTLSLGRLLLGNGADTEQVQRALVRFAAGFGGEAHLLVTYEGILLTLLSGEQFRTKVGYRLAAMNVNMAAVAALTQLVTRVSNHEVSLTEARQELEEIEHRPPIYNRWISVVALGLTAGSLARLFGADWPAFWIAWLSGSIGTWLRQELGRRGFNLFFIPFAGAVVSGVIGGLAVLAGLSTTPTLCLVAPGMIIVPGVPLVNSVHDIITNHMSLALNRLALGIAVTLAIAFGLFVAGIVTGSHIPVDVAPAVISVPEDALFSALAALGYLVLFNVPARIAWAGVICGVASHTTRTLLLHFGIDIVIGTLVGALAANFFAQAFARQFKAPAVAFVFPGVVAMVPGAYAFRAWVGCVEIVHGGVAAPTPVVTETLALIATCVLMVAAIAIGIAAPLIPAAGERGPSQ